MFLVSCNNSNYLQGGRSGDGQEGSLTKLDKQIKTVFSDFFKGSSEDKVWELNNKLLL